jgi:hypothetical protein
MFSLNNITANNDAVANFILYLLTNVENCKRNDSDPVANISMFGNDIDNPANWKSDVQLAKERKPSWN